MTAPIDACPRDRAVRSRDDGFTLTEILVTIALMGITVVSVMVGLRTTIGATVIDRDHAVSFTWLQAASDEIYRAPRVSCTSGQAAAISAYDAAAKAAPRPPAWDGTSASIRVINVEFLGKTGVDADFEWDKAFCFEGAAYAGSPLYTQRVSIETTAPNGTSRKTLQMVKSK
jgi:prepilin-type N-terminal cleavage/methylation domain-containing protein